MAINIKVLIYCVLWMLTPKKQDISETLFIHPQLCRIIYGQVYSAPPYNSNIIFARVSESDQYAPLFPESISHVVLRVVRCDRLDPFDIRLRAAWFVERNSFRSSHQ